MAGQMQGGLGRWDHIFVELHKKKSRVRWGTPLDQPRKMVDIYLTLLGGKGGSGNCSAMNNLCRHNLEKYVFSTNDNSEHTCEAP
jgi:hypothetical protein